MARGAAHAIALSIASLGVLLIIVTVYMMPGPGMSIASEYISRIESDAREKFTIPGEEFENVDIHSVVEKAAHQRISAIPTPKFLGALLREAASRTGTDSIEKEVLYCVQCESIFRLMQIGDYDSAMTLIDVICDDDDSFDTEMAFNLVWALSECGQKALVEFENAASRNLLVKRAFQLANEKHRRSVSVFDKPSNRGE